MKIVPHSYDPSPAPVAGEHVAVELIATCHLDLRYPVILCLKNLEIKIELLNNSCDF